VTRALYREFHRRKQRGFTDAEFRAVRERMAGATPRQKAILEGWLADR
jgi:hypothetical protein